MVAALNTQSVALQPRGRWLTYQGRQVRISALAREHGISTQRLAYRLSVGVALEAALTATRLDRPESGLGRIRAPRLLLKLVRELLPLAERGALTADDRSLVARARADLARVEAAKS